MAWVCAALAPAGTAQPAPPTLAQIDMQIEAIEGLDDLSEADRTEALDALREARRLVRTTIERAATVQSYVAQAAQSPTIREQIEAEMRDIDPTPDPVDLPETSDELRTRLELLRSERSAIAEQRGMWLAQQTELANRPGEIAAEIAAARAALADLADIPADTGASDPVSRAADILNDARRYERRTAIDALQRELETIPQRQPILSARLALADAELAALDSRIETIQQRLSDARMDQADAALERAIDDLEAVSDAPPAVQVLAEQNVSLAGQLQDMANGALQIEQDIGARQQQTQQISQQAETVERVVAAGRITDDVAALLRQVRAGLPFAQSVRDDIADAIEARVTTQLNIILWQDQLRSIARADEPAQYLFSYLVPIGDRMVAGERSVEAAKPLVEHRVRLLTDLVAAGRAQSDRLTELEITVRETLTASQALQVTLDRRLLWLPSNARPLRDWWSSVTSSFAWATAPSSRAGWLNAFTAPALANPLPFAALIVFSLALLVSAGTLRASVNRLNDAVGKVARDKYLTTPFAILCCVLLAAPIPLLIATVSVGPLLHEASLPLARAGATGACALAGALFLVLFFRVLRAPDGVLVHHFNWSRQAIAELKKPSVWFLVLLLGAVFVTAGALGVERPDVQHGIGMLAFIIASVSFGALGCGVFRFENGLAALMVLQGLSPIFLVIGLIGFAVAPIVIAALPLIGYFDTAVVLQARVLQSAAILLATAFSYSILRRQVLIAQRRLALRKAAERRARIEAERAEAEDAEDEDDTSSVSLPEELAEERQRISNQTRRILLYLAGFAALVALTTVWATILPALGIANEITLWMGSDTIAGMRTERPVTLWNLVLFFVFIAAGVVAAYNIRGVLEIGPFQRLKLSPGSRYAIDTIFGYLLIGIGVVAGFAQLGLDWSRLQWIIAALGVGLGFGLQEIVANFISGLIILFERPVRVGDMVTIGELEGTVSNIAIRATTITDFDNREVLLPNKSIITENVTNWTLKDTTLRIIVPIGVAYGSDVEKVRALLMDVAARNEDVMESPQAAVFFMNHGDSSLDFEVRVFISNPRKRFRVRHDLNTEINRVLTEARVEIPFPQRDIHIKQS